MHISLTNEPFEDNSATASTSDKGQTETSEGIAVRSASPPTPDIVGYISHVRMVPRRDIADDMKKRARDKSARSFIFSLAN